MRYRSSKIRSAAERGAFPVVWFPPKYRGRYHDRVFVDGQKPAGLVANTVHGDSGSANVATTRSASDRQQVLTLSATTIPSSNPVANKRRSGMGATPGPSQDSLGQGEWCLPAGIERRSIDPHMPNIMVSYPGSGGSAHPFSSILYELKWICMS